MNTDTTCPVNRSRRSIIGAIRDQLLKPGGLALAFTGIMLGLVAYAILPSWWVPAQALVALLVLTLAYIWVSGSALADSLGRENELQHRLDLSLAGNRYAPKVVQAMASLSEDSVLILLLEPNRLFGQSMLVSLYYEDERGFELLVGSGQVANVQTNGMIQISVESWENAHSDLRRGLLSQERSKIERLLVRPAPTTQSNFNPMLADLVRLAALQPIFEAQNDDGIR